MEALIYPEKSCVTSGAHGWIKSAISTLLVLYVISLTCSMAAMEISSWLMALLISCYFVFFRNRSFHIYRTGVEIPILVFILIALIGLLLNAPSEDFVLSMGRLRNLGLFFFVAYSLQFTKDIRRLFVLMAVCATVIAVYGIWHHFTGIDIWRHNNRALMKIPWGDKEVYATVGFFNHHLTYAHSFMMILCLPWAVLLLGSNGSKKLRALALISFAIILMSLIYTYARGVWIALIFGLPFMGFFVHRRIFLGAIAFVIVTGSLLFASDSQFRERALSVFDANNHSNVDRRQLWRANLAMFKDHPWFGVGYRENEVVVETYYKRLGIRDGMIGHAHNTYIQLLATMGLLGFLTYMILFGFFLILSWRLFRAIPEQDFGYRVIALAALGAQVCFHIGGLTQFNFGDMKVHHQFVFWLATVSFLDRRYHVPLTSPIHIPWAKIRDKIKVLLADRYLTATVFLAFVMVFIKKWEPGGNLDTIWYSAVAKNIYLSGDYFHFFISKYYIKDIFDHMPMTYWVTATVFKIFGPSDLSARIYPMICSFISYLLIYEIGKRIKDKTFGLLAVTVHVACFGASKWNGALMHDVPLTTYFLAVFYTFILGLRKPKYFYLTAVFFVFGVFTKGPVIFGFFLALIFWTLFEKKAPYLRERHFYYSCLLLMSLLMIPLYPGLYFGGLDIYSMFVIWKSSYLSPSSANRYFAYFIVVAETSTITVFPYLVSPFFMTPKRAPLTDESASILRLGFILSLCIILPFSIFTVKFPHYLLPFYPFLSLSATLPIYLLLEKIQFDLPQFVKAVSLVMLCVFIALPFKTTGKRSKEVLNLVNLIKLDKNIDHKMVYFLGHYSDDMTVFQTFKFYGSIDVKPLYLDQVEKLDLSQGYLLIKLKNLPLDQGTLHVTEADCLMVNRSYCVLTDKNSVSLNMPSLEFPHEIY